MFKISATVRAEQGRQIARDRKNKVEKVAEIFLKETVKKHETKRIEEQFLEELPRTRTTNLL